MLPVVSTKGVTSQMKVLPEPLMNALLYAENVVVCNAGNADTDADADDAMICCYAMPLCWKTRLRRKLKSWKVPCSFARLGLQYQRKMFTLGPIRHRDRMRFQQSSDWQD